MIASERASSCLRRALLILGCFFGTFFSFFGFLAFGAGAFLTFLAGVFSRSSSKLRKFRIDFLGAGDSTDSNGLTSFAMNFESFRDFDFSGLSGVDSDLKYDEITELKHTLFNRV